MVGPCKVKGKPPNGPPTDPGPPPDKPTDKKGNVIMTLEEALTLIKGKAKQQLWVRIEPYEDGYILCEKTLDLVASSDGLADPKRGKDLLITTASGTSTGAGTTTFYYQPTAPEIHEVHYMAGINTDAVDRGMNWGLTDGTTDVPISPTNIYTGTIFSLYPYDTNLTMIIGDKPIIVSNSVYLKFPVVALANTKVATVYIAYRVV